MIDHQENEKNNYHKPILFILTGCVLLFFAAVCVLLILLLVFGWQLVYLI